jgi:hypothetical protein
VTFPPAEADPSEHPRTVTRRKAPELRAGCCNNLQSSVREVAYPLTPMFVQPYKHWRHAQVMGMMAKSVHLWKPKCAVQASYVRTLLTARRQSSYTVSPNNNLGRRGHGGRLHFDNRSMCRGQSGLKLSSGLACQRQYRCSSAKMCSLGDTLRPGPPDRGEAY